MDLKSLVPMGRRSPARRTEVYDPFGAMRDEMERMFESFGRGITPFASTAGNGFLNPAVDIAETDKGLELTAELPGVAEKDIEVKLEDGVLTLKAERKVEKEEEGKDKTVYVSERSYGTYMRSFRLPFDVEEDAAKASFTDGVLKVTLPKSADEKVKSRKINING